MSLPDGFVIDEEPKLPKGFVLDSELPTKEEDFHIAPREQPVTRLSPFQALDQGVGHVGAAILNTLDPSSRGVIPRFLGDKLGINTSTEPYFKLDFSGGLSGELKTEERPIPYRFQSGQPILNPPFVDTDPVNRLLNRSVTGLSTPGSLVTLPFAASKAIQAYFLSQSIPGALEAGQKALDPATPSSERPDAALDALANTVISGSIAHGMGASKPYVPQGIKPTEPIYFDQRYQLPEKAGGYPNVQPAPSTALQLPRFAQSSLEGKTLPSSGEPIQLPQMMSEPRFVANAQGQQVDLSQLTEAERTELLRGPRVYEPSNKREAYTIPTIGEQPQAPSGYILDPTESQTQGPIESAYQAAGEAKQGGQVSFEGQRIPNAGQQAQEPVSAQSGPEIAKELGLINKEWPKEIPVIGGMQSFTDPSTGLTIEWIKPNTPLEEVSRLMENKLRENKNASTIRSNEGQLAQEAGQEGQAPLQQGAGGEIRSSDLQRAQASGSNPNGTELRAESSRKIIPVEGGSSRGVQKVYGGAFFLDPDYWKSIGEDTKKVVESVGNLAKRAEVDRQTLFDTIKRAGARADIAAKRDAVDTATFTTGIRAENHLALQATKEFGSEAMQARKALVAVVEAKGDRARLNQFEKQAAKNPEALAAVQFAKKYWNKLQKLKSTAEALDQFNQAQAKAADVNLPTTESYIKRIYEQEPEGLIGGRKESGTGSGSKIQRTYETLFDAIEAGHKSLTMDAAALIGKRTTEIQMEINKKGWVNSFKRVNDPVSKMPILADLSASPMGAKIAPKGYETVELMPGTSVGVLKGYKSIFDAVTARSRISGSLPGQYALETVGAVKHSMLAFDSFHAFRIYQFRKSLGLSGTYKDGLALLEYSKNDLTEAAKQGLIPDSAVAYAKEKFNLPQGDMARTDIASIGIRNGLNVARHSEAIYATFVREFPVLKQIVGAFNKFVFDKLSRGAMMEAFQNEFVRQAESHADWSSDKVAKTVATDINFRMGSIGRQGLFKSRQMQDLMQLVFLAPRWVESMAQSEVRSVAQFAKAAVPGTEHFMKIGTLAKSTGSLLAAYFVGIQILNYLTTGHGTWENPEDHKLEAYIPPIRKGEKAFYLSPFSVVAELTHDMIRYSRHDNIIGAASRIVQNKLSPLARAEEVLRTGTDWKGRKLDGVWDRVKEAAITAANPLPLPARQTVEAIKAKEAAPIERQAMAMAGLKAEPETYREKVSRETEGMSLDKRVAYMRQAKTERTPPTRQESAVYAARAIEGDQQRGEVAEQNLSTTARDWLKEHSYRIPGHEDKLHVRGVDLQLSPEEQGKLESYLQTEYEKRIKTLANPNFAKLAPAIQKNVFDANMRDAGKAARGKLAIEIQKRK